MDNDGYISNGELFQVLKMMVGNNLKETQLQQIVDKTVLNADKDGDGKISFDEFCAVSRNIVTINSQHILGCLFWLFLDWVIYLITPLCLSALWICAFQNQNILFAWVEVWNHKLCWIYLSKANFPVKSTPAYSNQPTLWQSSRTLLWTIQNPSSSTGHDKK